MKLLNKKKSDIPRRRLVENNTDKVVSSSDIFRRNRTLSGTTLNNFGGTNIKPSDLESNRKHAHHLVNHRRKVLSLLTVVLIAAFLLWTLVSNLTASVFITVSNTNLPKTVDSSRYIKVIQEYLDHNPLSRLHFMLDQTSLNDYVSSKLPEVLTVSQRFMVGIGETDFTIKFRTPMAGWKMNEKQYFVDSNGIAFEQNWLTAPDVQIVDNSGASPQGSVAVASNRFLGFIGKIVSLSKISGYTVTQAVLPVNTTRELDINVKESNIMVKLSIDRPAGEQIEDMNQALKYFVSVGQSPQYIDIRVSGKAFYK